MKICRVLNKSLFHLLNFLWEYVEGVGGKLKIAINECMNCKKTVYFTDIPRSIYQLIMMMAFIVHLSPL